MPRSIRVAAVQLGAHDRGAFPRSLAEILSQARVAASRADLVVLPEATFPAYVLERNSDHDAAAVAGALAQLQAIATETATVIVAGAAIHEGASLRNRGVVIDADGSLAGGADKLFLWHFDRRWFDAGECLEPIPTALGKLGVLVCADGRIPTIARTLVDRGAELLVMPTAWVTTGRDPHRLENVQADLLARVRAFENGVPFVAANKCGTELGVVAYCGKSQIVDASGALIAIANETQSETIVATIASGSRPHRVAVPKAHARTMELLSPLRIAISFEALPDDVDRTLEFLDDGYAIAPDDRERFDALDAAIPAVYAADEAMLDPGFLAAYRRAGYRIAVWASSDGEWAERIARSRALELRIYVICFDRSKRRAFAVDPDGNVVAGTFDGYRIASFLFDPRKTAELAVAPGSDIGEALERIATIALEGSTQR
jgi:predicted amidohydrolase